VSEIDLDLLSDESTSSPARRAAAFIQGLGISEISYPQILEDSVRHAAAPRDGPLLDQPWVSLGPRNVGGRIVALAQDPTNRLILYAGSAHGGLWRTVDAGDTWEHLGDAEHNFPVAAIAIPEQDSTTLYVGTGSAAPDYVSGRGIYRVKIATPPRFERLAPAHPPNIPPADVNRNPALRGAALRYTRIRMDPFDKDRFWAASQSGLWRWEGLAPEHERFVLEFPAPIPGGPPPLPGAIVPPAVRYESYATDVLVAPDPRDRTPVRAGSRIPRFLILYVAVFGQGVYRGRFDRQTRTTHWEKRLDIGAPARIQLTLCERLPQRVYALMDRGNDQPTPVFRSDDNGETWRETTNNFDAAQKQASYDLVVEASPTDPDVVYAGIVDGYLTRDGGAHWDKVLVSDDYNNLGDYAQHADQHSALFDRFERRRLWVGNDGGLAMARDLQAPLRSRGYWRQRSHGIAAGQFQAVAADPTRDRAFMTAGGLQDNGSWLSFGGPTWIRVGWADGGFFAFDPGNPRRYPLSQDFAHAAWNVALAVPPLSLFNPVVHDLTDADGRSDVLAPRNAMGMNVNGILVGDRTYPFVPLIAQNAATPAQLILGWRDTGVPEAAAYWSIDAGVTVTANPLNGLTPAITPPNTVGTAACFGPELAPGAHVEGWVGFSNGNLVWADNAPSAPVTPWAKPPSDLPWPAGRPQKISGIAVHPTDPAIVVVCSSGAPGRVFLTYNRGARWHDVTARVPASIAITPHAPAIPAAQRRQFTATARFADGSSFDATTIVQWDSTAKAKADFSHVPGEEGQLITVAAGATDVTATWSAAIHATTTVTVTAGAGAAPPPLPSAQRDFDLQSLPPCPMTSIVFSLVALPSRIFVGTLAGVYVMDLPVAPAAGAEPVFSWRPCSQGLPLTLVNCIVNVPRTNVLRAATFGRGIWDCDLGAATRQQHRLLIRQTIIEDGFTNATGADTYERHDPLLGPVTDDPRLPAARVALDNVHAFDIRIDAPPRQFFDDRVDGVEFDERLGADILVPLATNSVYVQVHNVGKEEVPNVRVHLYFQRSPIAAPNGAAAVNLPAGLGDVTDFYHPDDDFNPSPGATWARVGPPQTLRRVGPAAPAVARFDWQPPAALAGQNVALLALCSGPDDAHDKLPADAAASPNVSVTAFILRERRSALRIAHVAPLPFADIFIRSGVDDDGRKSSVASTTRSPDIVVVQSKPEHPEQAFRDLLDARPQGRLRGGVENFIYVRVHNRGQAAVHAQVEFWAVKIKADLTPDFPSANWQPSPSLAPVEIDVPAGGWALGEFTWTPPEPAGTLKSYILIALVKSADDNDPHPLPDRTVIDSEEKFWRFLSRQDGSDNVAARAIRWMSS